MRFTIMTKYRFQDDYSEGCHPKVLEILQTTNMVQQQGYGYDEYSQKAKELIKAQMQTENSLVYFVSGGTQANLIVISSLLRPHEAVISADTGHINTHETGAIENTGHKVLACHSADGKLKISDIQFQLDYHGQDPHMVKPRLVYISNSTELGTVYNKSELIELYSFCQSNNLLLFVDGARLGAALTSADNDISLKDMGIYTDVFYIGGTKNGALLGEAIVINNMDLQLDFEYYLKQKGALTSKSRTIGIQFLALFQDDLFYNIASHANKMASTIADALKEKGVEFLVEPMSNQLFPIFSNATIAFLKKNYEFHIWEKYDDNSSVIRIVCSWATPKNIVDEFISDVIQKV